MKSTNIFHAVFGLLAFAFIFAMTPDPAVAQRTRTEGSQRSGRTTQSRPSRTEKAKPAPKRTPRAKPSTPSRQRQTSPARSPRTSGSTARKSPTRSGTRTERSPTRTTPSTGSRGDNRSGGRVERTQTRTTPTTGTRSDNRNGSRSGGRVDRTQTRNTPSAGNRSDTRRGGRVDRTQTRNNPVTRGRNDRVFAGNRGTLRRPGVRVPVRAQHRHVYAPRRVYSRYQLRARWPRIHVHIDWPWIVRYQRHWSPRYRYRQVIIVQTTQAGQRHQAQVEVETFYKHRVVEATSDAADLEIEIDRIDIYQDGRFIGHVDRIPDDLRYIQARVWRGGDVEFDREISLLGDARTGFEMVATNHYDGYVLDDYRRSDGYIAGRLDLRDHRVRTIRQSRLFHPDRFDGIVPISLLPEREGWLWDYGVEAISAGYDDYDYYYGGSGTSQRGPTMRAPVEQTDGWTQQTSTGAEISVQRSSRIQRVN